MPDVAAMVDGRFLMLDLVAVSYCTGRRAAELVAQRSRLPVGRLPALVANKITSDARSVLSEAGWSWLDRRGRLHLRGPGVLVEVDVPTEQEAKGAHSPANLIAGRSGLAVAYWLCAHPSGRLSPTGDRHELALAPSSISTVVGRLRGAGLVHAEGTGIFPELFWELAEVWESPRTWLAGVPDPAGHSGPDPESGSWRRTGTEVAAALGAPVVTGGDGPVDLYVGGPVEVSIAVRRHGVAQPGTGVASLRVAPVRAVVTSPLDSEVADVGGWLPAPRLAVALDLAQDRARGREILDDWSPPDAVWQ